ncbi:hypothetical protein NC652_000242 [Populus alba x Populus x berolinensis]|nr:hypothetical protein NC652_000242 [Populus alba x Populus x berolinensis]
MIIKCPWRRAMAMVTNLLSRVNATAGGIWVGGFGRSETFEPEELLPLKSQVYYFLIPDMIRSRKPAVGDSNKTFPSETLITVSNLRMLGDLVGQKIHSARHFWSLTVCLELRSCIPLPDKKMAATVCLPYQVHC